MLGLSWVIQEDEVISNTQEMQYFQFICLILLFPGLNILSHKACEKTLYYKLEPRNTALCITVTKSMTSFEFCQLRPEY